MVSGSAEMTLFSASRVDCHFVGPLGPGAPGRPGCIGAPGTSFIDKLVSTTNSSTAGFDSGSAAQPSQALLLMAATCSGVRVSVPPILLAVPAEPPPDPGSLTTNDPMPAVAAPPAVVAARVLSSLVEPQARLKAKLEMQASRALVFMGSLPRGSHVSPVGAPDVVLCSTRSDRVSTRSDRVRA